MILATFCRKLPAFVANFLVCVLAGNSAFGQARATHFTATNLLSLRQSLQSTPEATASISIEGTICVVCDSGGTHHDMGAADCGP